MCADFVVSRVISNIVVLQTMLFMTIQMVGRSTPLSFLYQHRVSNDIVSDIIQDIDQQQEKFDNFINIPLQMYPSRPPHLECDICTCLPSTESS